MTSEIVKDKPGSLKTWLDYIESIDPNKMELGLSRVKAVLDKLNLSFLNKVPVIEVAGTNGKGSTSALIAGILNNSSIKTGLYTSPHLHKFNERVCISGVPVKDEVLAQAFSTVHENCGEIKLTYFEYTTLAALVCFSIEKVDAIVLEVGLGGRLDAVNVVDANISVITSIGLDHIRILGDTIEKIAFEKAGVIKEHSKVVTGVIDKSALDVIKAEAKKRGATVFVENEDFEGQFDDGFKYIEKKSLNLTTFMLPYPKIPYCCAPAAIKVIILLREMGLNISSKAVIDAIKTVALPGRMQLVSVNPTIYLDVAHNPPAALNLVKTINNRPKLANRYALIGMLKDKDIESVIKIISHSFDGFYLATLHTARGETKERLEKVLIKCQVPQSLIKSYHNVKDAVCAVLKGVQKNDEIIVLGSFVTVSEAMDALEIK